MNEVNRNTHVAIRAKRAVTLTEVTVSVTAVAALLATTLTTGAEARRQSKEVHCIGNLNRITHATSIHATLSPNEFSLPNHPLAGVIPGALGEIEWGGKAGAGEPLSGPGPTTSKWGTQEGRGPATRKLNEILYKDRFVDYRDDPGIADSHWINDTRLDLDVFRCPSDYGYTGHHFVAWRNSKLTSFDHYGNSYVASTSWVGTPGGGCTLESITAYLRPVSRVPNPARTVLLEENCGRFGSQTNYGTDGCSSLSGALGMDVEGIIRGWHGTPFTFNLAFVDGHVARTYVNGHIQPQPDIVQYPEGTSYEFWKCVIIRGLDWQRDTLPAPPIRTNLSCSVANGASNPIK